MFLEILLISQENICARVSILIKLQASGLQLYLKNALAQVFSCEFWEISKSTFFTEHLWTTASEYEKVVDRHNFAYLCNYFDKNLRSTTLAVTSICRMIKNLEFLSIAVLKHFFNKCGYYCLKHACRSLIFALACSRNEITFYFTGSEK